LNDVGGENGLRGDEIAFVMETEIDDHPHFHPSESGHTLHESA